MTERERLTELIRSAMCWGWTEPSEIAERLIEDGDVIVPPCRVGDTVYYLGGIRNSLVKSATVEEIIANSNGVSDLLVNSENGVTFENSIDIFYFTREEAEAALERRKHEDRT